MKITIVVQRACIVAGCLLWMLLFLAPLPHTAHKSGSQEATLRLGNYLTKDSIVGILMLFGIVERMCAVGNNLVMERNWVPTIASEVSKPPLHQLNAIMRRIDLVSKILAPVFVSTIAIKTSSVVLVIVTAGVNLATVGIELATARTAWNKCNALKLAREPKNVVTVLRSSIDDEDAPSVIVVPEEIQQEKRGLALYFSNDVCLGRSSPPCQSSPL
jgi:iron-regulated transporter 1